MNFFNWGSSEEPVRSDLRIDSIEGTNFGEVLLDNQWEGEAFVFDDGIRIVGKTGFERFNVHLRMSEGVIIKENMSNAVGIILESINSNGEVSITELDCLNGSEERTRLIHCMRMLKMRNHRRNKMILEDMLNITRGNPLAKTPYDNQRLTNEQEEELNWVSYYEKKEKAKLEALEKKRQELDQERKDKCYNELNRPMLPSDFHNAPPDELNISKSMVLDNLFRQIDGGVDESSRISTPVYNRHPSLDEFRNSADGQDYSRFWFADVGKQEVSILQAEPINEEDPQIASLEKDIQNLRAQLASQSKPQGKENASSNWPQRKHEEDLQRLKQANKDLKQRVRDMKRAGELN